MRISDWSSDVCSSDLADTGFGNAALRAARQAFTGREVELSDRADPLAPVAAGGARMALVEADAFFDLSGSAPVRNERFEAVAAVGQRSEEHTSELQSLMRISYAVFCLKKKNKQQLNHNIQQKYDNTVTSKRTQLHNY